MSKPKAKPIPDQPSSCSVCIYRHQDTDVLRCRRHAPSTGREEHEVAYWPVVLPTDVCFMGSLGNNPKAQHVECETCMAWHYTEGGIKPRFPGSLPDTWWLGSGLCRLRAPAPKVDDDTAATQWPIVSFMAGCGDGINKDKPADEEED